MVVLESAYLLISFLLALVGFNSLYLIVRCYRTHSPRPQPSAPVEWPTVTVQLPLYNELHMVDRLLWAVNDLDYPRQRLEVQVLDDSTDETSQVIARAVEAYRSAGLNILHVRRRERIGYKAGALQAGLRRARGEFLAVFDADFIPPPDFLRRAVPWFADPQVGCVQGRWTHTNRDFSLLTRLQALFLDAHGVVVQAARSRAGLFLQFTGTAALIRKSCLEALGGWSADTLTEDFDFSFQAQLRGWRIEYLPELSAPAELPVQMAAFKRQQARWAKGSLQTARKHWRPLLRSRLPLLVKTQAVFLLLHYLVYPLALGLLLLALPLSLSHSPMLGWASLSMVGVLAMPLLYLSAGDPQGPGGWQRLALTPGLLLLGIGLSAVTSWAALEGLFVPERGAFLRTPKFALLLQGERWQHSRYTLQPDAWAGIEVLWAMYALFCALSLPGWNWGTLFWSLIYILSFAFVAWTSIAERMPRKRGTE